MNYWYESAYFESYGGSGLTLCWSNRFCHAGITFRSTRPSLLLLPSSSRGSNSDQLVRRTR